jgi:hypothetical protein
VLNFVPVSSNNEFSYKIVDLSFRIISFSIRSNS